MRYASFEFLLGALAVPRGAGLVDWVRCFAQCCLVADEFDAKGQLPTPCRLGPVCAQGAAGDSFANGLFNLCGPISALVGMAARSRVAAGCHGRCAGGIRHCVFWLLVAQRFALAVLCSTLMA